MKSFPVMKNILSASVVLSCLVSAAAFAGPVNGTGNVTPNAIYGGGNDNGSFTGTNANGVELGLRAHLRFDLSGNPQNIFNYDGDHTYSFDPANSNPAAGWSIFNMDWSINSDSTGQSGRNLDALTYMLHLDSDPSAGYLGFDIDPLSFFPDNTFGNNSTANGAGLVGTAADAATNNVVQNSWNLGFNPFNLSPQSPGIYTFSLEAWDGGRSVGSTSIDVIVGAAAAVPLPPSLPLLVTGLILLGINRRKQK